MGPVMTIPQVAEYLQIPRSKLYLMPRRGNMPYIDLGRNNCILESDLIEWLEKIRMPQKQSGFRFLEES